MLKEQVKPGNFKFSHHTRIQLKDIGISEDQSSRWQTIADLPEKELEKHIVNVKASKEELTTVGVVRLEKSNYIE